VKHIFDLVIRNFRLAQSKGEARDLIEGALQVVGMRGEEVLEKYPHQLSGGQRQRMMVARAYMVKPSLIVADEPVSMVDASLRAMILDIMLRLRDEHNISFLYITHDLSTAYQVGDQIYLLYQGVVAEKGDTAKVIENPKHPYYQTTRNCASALTVAVAFIRAARSGWIAAWSSNRRFITLTGSIIKRHAIFMTTGPTMLSLTMSSHTMPSRTGLKPPC
jgi:ABC-type oligopeptide transport system ATPase subunit